MLDVTHLTVPPVRLLVQPHNEPSSKSHDRILFFEATSQPVLQNKETMQNGLYIVNNIKAFPH